jgi:hypothetical protein
MIKPRPDLCGNDRAHLRERKHLDISTLQIMPLKISRFRQKNRGRTTKK